MVKEFAAAILFVAAVAAAQVKSDPLPAPMKDMPVRFQPPTGQGYYIPRAPVPYIGAMDTSKEMPSPVLPNPNPPQPVAPASVASASASAAGWTTVAKEGDTVTVPAGTTVRYGIGTDWNPAKTFASGTTFVVDNGFFGKDPIYGKVKELAVKSGTVGVVVNGMPASQPKAGAPAPAVPKAVATPTQPRVISSVSWTKLANEGEVLTVPANVTLRYGSEAGGWSAPRVITKSTTFTVSSSYFGGTPKADPGNVLEVQSTLTGAAKAASSGAAKCAPAGTSAARHLPPCKK